MRTRLRTPQRRAILWRLALIAGVALAWLVTTAHVGTNQVVMEGRAGGYELRVMINPPGVVPAQVPIIVRVLNGAPSRVTVRAAQWNVGTRGAPPPEEAALVPGDPGVYAHELWIMTASTYAVHVAVEGAMGNGALVVPMQTASTRTLGMQRVMGGVLLVLGSLLVLGLVTIVGAATREGTLTPGNTASGSSRRNARVAVGITSAVLALALFGGAKWWDAEEAAYKRRMFQPIAIDAAVRAIDDAQQLTIAITDTLWGTARISPIMPDHGKLMHLFLVRLDAADVLAHLHPLRTSTDSFTTRLPPLPAGRYAMFGDILLQSGAQRTLVDTVDVPDAPVLSDAQTQIADSRMPPLDPDDAWRLVTPTRFSTPALLSGGGTLTLSADAELQVGRDLRLTATVTEPDGSLSPLEPYMGMLGHAMVYRKDGTLFMHLHPMGTASMTAQLQLQRRENGDTATTDSSTLASALTQAEDAAAQAHAQHAARTPAFPFVFPTAGEYRVFVQVKRKGVVETAAFDVSVPAEAAMTARR
jgi:hypothetical protein